MLLKKGITLTVITLFLFVSIYPTKANTFIIKPHNEQNRKIFFGLKSYIDITFEAQGLFLHPVSGNLKL